MRVAGCVIYIIESTTGLKPLRFKARWLGARVLALEELEQSLDKHGATQEELGTHSSRKLAAWMMEDVRAVIPPRLTRATPQAPWSQTSSCHLAVSFLMLPRPA